MTGASTDTAALQALAAAVVTTYLPGKVPASPAAAYAVLYGGTASPQGRALDGTTPARLTIHRLMAVSNNSAGARILTAALVDAIDGHTHDASPWLVVAVSDPLEDKGDPSAYRWTCTVEIHHHTHR